MLLLELLRKQWYPPGSTKDSLFVGPDGVFDQLQRDPRLGTHRRQLDGAEAKKVRRGPADDAGRLAAGSTVVVDVTADEVA